MSKPASSRGRPRSAKAREAVLASALLLLQEKGYGAVTIEGIAAHSQVAKQTIYRHWNSKGEIILDAFTQWAQEQAQPPDTGHLEDDLRLFLRRTFQLQQNTGATINRALIAHALTDPGFAELLGQRLIAPRREAARTLLQQARARGPLHASDDLLLDLMFGPMWYRLLVNTGPVNTAQLDDAYADELAAAVARVALGKGADTSQVRQANLNRV